MRRIWRTTGIVVLVLTLVGTPAALAKGRPGSGPSCPVAGGAQVVLDPGHGGSDTGAYNSTYGVYEKDLTLQIAQLTAGILGSHYSVALTRDSDVELGNSERGEIANACGASVFVEIHVNGSSDPTVDFTQTFWGKKRKDQDFAVTMDNAMNSLGIPNNGAGQFANGGLLTATMPSTLVEAVFLTNDDEANRLVNGTRQDEIAQAIAAGVETWLG